MNPQNILLLKAHSMGIGDLLRSSAAWAALRKTWPQARLHLMMLSRHPGYPTEALIREHHLLDSAHFISLADRDADGQVHKRPLSAVREAMRQALAAQEIDLVIDFEMHGLRTTLLARAMARAKRAMLVGVAQFPLRGWFYDRAAPSLQAYARRQGLGEPMDYTERDFVALAALGIARSGQQIELHCSAAGQAWRAAHIAPMPGWPTFTLNIGCGTPDALPKRPPMDALVAAMLALRRRLKFRLLLSGAPFEDEVNRAFMQAFAQALAQAGLDCPMENFAGQGSISELTGLLQASDLVISTDSGPYHMAVGMDVPTVCWFNWPSPFSEHHKPNVRTLVLPTPAQFVEAAEAVLSA